MPFFDDTTPFRKRVKDIADKVESKRQEFNESRRRKGLGTFKGLESIVAKRMKEAGHAKRNSY